jgi:hypothetical protein
MLFIFFIISLLLLLIFYLNFNKLIIYFYDQIKLGQILQTDFDNFYQNLNTINLQIRNINNKYNFLSNIHFHLYSCSNKEKNIIKNAIYKANNKLKNVNFIGFNYNKIKNIPWLIGCSINNNYEFGYPHTRGPIIILNYDNIYNNNLYKTLIHERIHIYQKLFPEDIKLFLNKYKFKPIRKQNDYDRANPDINNIVYSKNNKIFQCIINTKKNNIIEYTNDSFYFEHPFEYMAYMIENLC